MDLRLADLAAGVYKNPKPSANPLLKPPMSNLGFLIDQNEKLKRLRDGAYRRQLHYDQQLALMLNREKYQQNKTWQAEWDRLASTTPLPHLQPYVDDRLDKLKSLIKENKPVRYGPPSWAA